MAEFSIDLQKVRQLRTGAYSVPLTARVGTSGQIVAGGLVLTEHNPTLHPLEARGSLGHRGRFQKIARHAAVSAALQRRKKAIASADWRLESAKMPRVWANNRKKLTLAERQMEYCDYLFWRWSQPGQRNLAKWAREVLTQAPVAGFWLGEIVAEQVLFEFSDGSTAMVWVPGLPEYRAPESVTAWVFQNDDLVGVALDGGIRSEYDGQTVPTSAILPANKFLLISRDRAGAQAEGESEMRAINKHVELHWALQEIEAQAIERRGLEELFFTRSSDAAEDLSPEDMKILTDYLKARLTGMRVAGEVLPEGVSPELVSSGTNMPDVTAPLSRHWQSTLMGMGAEDRGMATGGGGSYAARATAAQGSLSEHADDAKLYFVEPLRELLSRAIQWSDLHEGNPDNVFTPNITASPLHDQTGPIELTQALATMKGAGLLSHWSIEDENSVRSRLGHRDANHLEDPAIRPEGDPSSGERVGPDGRVHPEPGQPVRDPDEEGVSTSDPEGTS